MSINKQCFLIILSVLNVTLCFECMSDKNIEQLSLNYDEINVIEGIKFKRDVATLHNNLTNADDSSTSDNLNDNSKEVSLHKIAQIFLNNHVMEFNIARMLQEETDVGTPRRRRHQQAFSMVLTGIVIFLMFFVTLGFQFLATFSGKAFLMAKMALLLASINGLKRIASSGVHYGLYQTPDPNFYPYERYDRPRKLKILA